ncbi:MAG TPA: ribonuclease HII [Bdellovibrionales bacterium]|nr:ribonuclease HII [Bdellovibrionales bacterium]
MLRKFGWRKLTPAPIIGVDEVGRGCLAGPVYAAAVILKSETDTRHYTDSKLISEKRREELSLSIRTHHRYGIGIASVEEIEQLNILKASLLAMARAVQALGVESGHLLVDGKFRIPNMPGFEQTPLVKGDLRAAPISAASIVAKVARDNLMNELAQTYGHYGFEKNKGYGTEFHRSAIAQHGICAVHRKTFLGVREFVATLEPRQGTLV